MPQVMTFWAIYRSYDLPKGNVPGFIQAEMP